MARKTMRKNGKKTMKKNATMRKHTTPVKKKSLKYMKTGSLKKVHLIFKAQALSNARKLFGYNVTS